MPALGFIETRGRVGAVEAADAALKMADVELIMVRKVSGGLVTVVITGEVAAVKASIEAAKIKAKMLSNYCCTNVIPGPAKEIEDLIAKIRVENGPRVRAKKKA